MTQKKWIGGFVNGMIWWMACGVLVSGCSSLKGLPGMSGPGRAPLYYEGFQDILVPGELKPDRKNTSVFQSHGFAAGILAFYGRVEPRSLMTFFRENMVKDGWRDIGSITASKSILLFQKESRWCVIGISESDFNTFIEIGVVPTGSGREAGAFPSGGQLLTQ